MKPYWQQLQEQKLKSATGMVPLTRVVKTSTRENSQKNEKLGDKVDKIPATPKIGNKKRKKPMKKRSKKEVKVIRQLRKLYTIFLATRPDCEIRMSPNCQGAATVVNHNKGRGANVLNQADWTPCCPPCNDEIEKKHKEAEALGFKKSRHKITSDETENT